MQTPACLLSSRILVAALCACLSAIGQSSPLQLRRAPAAPVPDDRYKADILVMVAHPDDETVMTGYLARAIFDQHRRVAVIYGTRGNAGGNVVGQEQAESLGAIREIEARRALAVYGIMNVWFLDGSDTPGQDVLRSLETWNHGQALWKAVRLVRLTRPEVILTWIPDYVVGENHGDHQAAGVIATEAFDLAGNPTVFPEQVAAPRDRFNIGNLLDGLHPWQPQKIYYSTDASHSDWLNGKGPQYATTDVSASRGVPYYRLIAEEMSFHLTQSDTGMAAHQAIQANDFHIFQEPERFIFGKSHVRASTTGDVFEGVVAGPLPYTPALQNPYRPQSHSGLWIEFGGPWAFYREFWRAHAIDHIAGLLAPEAGVAAGDVLHIPILIHNDTDHAVEVALTSVVPAGWSDRWGSALYPVAAHESYPAETLTQAPTGKSGTWTQITWKAETAGRQVGSITLRVMLTSGALPQ